MMFGAIRSGRAALPAFACLLLAAAAPAQEESRPAPPVTIEKITVEPDTPGADTLCRLRVRIANTGEHVASRFGFAVSLNGQDLGVYGNQIFMFPVGPGASEEISLYNFWTTETSRGMPADGKLRVEVALREAVWTKMSTETDEEGEIEVWAPIGPVENLPAKAEITVQMKTGG